MPQRAADAAAHTDRCVCPRTRAPALWRRAPLQLAGRRRRRSWCSCTPRLHACSAGATRRTTCSVTPASPWLPAWGDAARAHGAATAAQVLQQPRGTRGTALPNCTGSTGGARRPRCARRRAAPRRLLSAPKRPRYTAPSWRRPGTTFPRPPARRAARMEVGSDNSAVLRAAGVLIVGGDDAASLGTLQPGDMLRNQRSWRRAARAAGALLFCYVHATHSCAASAETRPARAQGVRTRDRAPGSCCAARAGGAPAHLLQGPSFGAPPRRRLAAPGRETSHTRFWQYSAAAAQVSGRTAHATVTFGNVGGPVSRGCLHVKACTLAAAPAFRDAAWRSGSVRTARKKPRLQRRGAAASPLQLACGRPPWLQERRSARAQAPPRTRTHRRGR